LTPNLSIISMLNLQNQAHLSTASLAQYFRLLALMATLSLPGLQAFIAELGLEPIPSFTSANILSNPLDIYHSYLAGHFHALVECDADLVYNSIQLSNTTGNGDLDIVLPKLKLLGANPKDFAGELLKKVGDFSTYTRVCSSFAETNESPLISTNLIPSSLFHSRMASIFDSFSPPK